jgi:hypothetical protein
MSLLLSLLSVSVADIAPRPTPNTRFTTYSVRVEGLEAFPDVVILLHQKGDTLRGYRTFTAEQPQQQIADGSRARGNNIYDADLFVISTEAYEAWKTETAAEARRQIEACENGEGCSHISRFTPKYPPPVSETPCRTSIEITTSTAAGGQDGILDTFQITAAAPGTCALQGPTRTTFGLSQPTPEQAPGAAPEQAPGAAPEQAPAPAPEAASVPSDTQCSAVTMSGSTVLSLLLVVAGASRRRRYPDAPSRSAHGHNTARRTL